VVGRRLDACLFIARNQTALPSRQVLAALLGTRIEPEARSNILAGGIVGATNASGPTICACFGVGLNTLNDAIVSRRLTNVAAIGAALRAGTNCGSCIPELKAILSAHARKAASA